MNRVLTLLPAVLLFCDCGAQAEIKVLTEEQSGQEIILHAGDKVSVRLQENPTTGYGWEFFWEPEKQNIAGDITENYAQDKTDGKMLGVGGVKTYEFTAENEGTTTLSGYYYRPWEKLDKNTAESVVYTFKVEP